MSEEKKNSILVVDDERSNISVLKTILGPEYTIYASTDGEDAVETAEEFMPDLILLDIIMPEMDGYDVIAALQASEKTQNIPVIFITGLDNAEAEGKGLALGAVDYIAKPFNDEITRLRVRIHMNLINNYRTLHERTERLLRLQNSMASVLASMVENRDKLTGIHIEQTAVFLKILLYAMVKNRVYADQIADWDVDVMVSSSRLHDIGKIAVSDLILNKPGKLTAIEYEKMRSHAIEGERIIDDIIAESGEDETFLHNARIFASSHHERWDGSGYPHGLKGFDIPLQGRILAIADVYDALVSDRPYKQAFTHERAIEIILEGKDHHFDPQIVDIFLTVSDLFAEVVKQQGLETESKSAIYDELTSVYSRFFFEESIDRLLKSLSRSDSLLSLLIVDIDCFKKYNETYGQSAGDDCLKAIADVLRNSMKRTDDFVVRYGGEEFIIVLPKTDESGASIVAQRLLESVRERNIPHEKSDVSDHVTVSIGVITGKVEYSHTAGDFIERATEVLSKSKHSGRDRYSAESL